jgi:hypothetical protein
VYSDSEFKYEIKRKTQNNDRASRYCNDNRCDYGSDFSFDWFDIWGLSFFDIKRRRHYRHLNEAVFRPLTNLESRQILPQKESATEYFNYDVVVPMESSRIFQLALKHMKEDQPQLPTEISNLREMLNRHKILLESVEVIIRNTINESFSQTYRSPLKIGSIHGYNVNYIYLCLKRVWESSKFDLEQIENHIKSGSVNVRRDNGHFYIDSYDIGQVNEKEFQRMKNTFYDTLKNMQILKGFSDLKQNTNDIRYKIEEIKGMTNETVESIDNDLYETNIKGCCPTFLRIFR